jgi:hypothetical protein
VLVLVLDPKRISRSVACTSGNFEIGTGFHFGQPYQPFEHEDEHSLPDVARRFALPPAQSRPRKRGSAPREERGRSREHDLVAAMPRCYLLFKNRSPAHPHALEPRASRLVFRLSDAGSP